jgi:hypothetical protein
MDAWCAIQAQCEAMAEGGHSDGGFTTGGEEVAAGERTIPCIPNVDMVSFIPKVLGTAPR